MSDARQLDALLRACKDDPTNDDVRRVLADLLEDLGDTDRAEFVRLQLDTPAEERGEWDAGRAERLARMARLLRRHASDWLGGTFWWDNTCKVPGVEGEAVVGFERGLAWLQPPANVRSLPETWPPWVVPWLERVEDNEGDTPDATWEALCRGPYLEGFSDLQLGWWSPDPAAVLGLVGRGEFRTLGLRYANSELLTGLARMRGFRPHRLSLYLGENTEGWASLATSPALSEVRGLELALRADASLELLAAAAPLDNLYRLAIEGGSWAGLRELLLSARLSRVTELSLATTQGERSDIPVAELATSSLSGNLRRLVLFHNQLPDDSVAALAASRVLQSVEVLDLTHSVLTPTGAAALFASPQLAHLASLDLSSVSLGDLGCMALARSTHLGRLRRLKLSSCDIGDEGVRALAKSPFFATLEELDLTLNPVGDAGLEALAGAGRTKLRRLTLDHIAASERGWTALLASPVLSGLVAFSARYNRIGSPLGPSLARHPGLGSLRTLDIAGNQLGLAGLQALAGAPWLPDLVELHLSGNDLGDAGLDCLLARLPESRLAELGVVANHLGPQGGRALLAWPGLPHLVSLVMYNNLFGGDLEEQIRAVVAAGPV